LAQAHAFRETRIFQANQGLPIIIWLVLSFYGLVLVVFVLFAGVRSRIGHFFFAAVFATSVVLVFILVRMLDYPFEGALTLSNDDFIQTIGRINMLIGA
jgi:glucan phosphoethanolaminetransferase (alkaline phosphatase superfamily)